MSHYESFLHIPEWRFVDESMTCTQSFRTRIIRRRRYALSSRRTTDEHSNCPNMGT